MAVKGLTPTISILGCGWLGSALASSLIHKGYHVKGSTRSGNLKMDIPGLELFTFDIEEETPHYASFLESQIMVIAIPSKNIPAFKRLIAHLEQAGLKNVVYISSTSVYPFTNGTVTEETQTKDTPLAEIESLFRASNAFQATIVRFGGLFGYNRKPGNFVKPGRKMSNPEGFINLIHQDDCVRIIEAIIAQNAWGETLNGVTDSHPKRRAFYIKEAAKVGKTEVEFDEDSETQYKIVSNKKLKELLSYEFIHSDLMAY